MCGPLTPTRCGSETVKATFPLLAASLGLVGCSTFPPPGIALQDVVFAEQPYIVKREDQYYLHYRRALEKEHTTLPRVLWTKKTKDKAYYYFSTAISHVERGGIIERPLAYDHFTGFAQRNAVYWLNPDGSEVRLQIREAAESGNKE